MLEDERQLIKLVKEGRSEAFGRLYDYYLPKIYRFVLIRTAGQREEAEDLSHQVFLKAWQNIKNYNDRGHPFSSWLYRIARNSIVDYYRQNQTTILSLEELTINEPEGVFEEEKEIGLAINIKNVVKAVQELKQIEQDVIIMRFVEDMPIAEVALNIGKSQGAVKLIQHRALKQLKKILDENGRNY